MLEKSIHSSDKPIRRLRIAMCLQLVLVCDSAQMNQQDNLSYLQALDGLKCRRRVLLSGTPMQNHLDEVA